MYFPVPIIRPGSLIFLSTKSPWGRPYYDRVANFSLRHFPHGVPYYDQVANFPTKVEHSIYTKVTISRVFLIDFGEKKFAN